MSLLTKIQEIPKYLLVWQDKKGETVAVSAPDKEESKELFLWLAEQTGMKS